MIVDGTLTVNPKVVTITTGSATRAYNGSALTNATAKIEGLVDGERVTLTATGSQTLVGSSTNTYDIIWDNANAANYTVTEKLGTLTVTDRPEDEKYEITVVENSNTGNIYDGTAKSAVGFETLTFTVEGNIFTVSGLETSDPSRLTPQHLPT